MCSWKPAHGSAHGSHHSVALCHDVRNQYEALPAVLNTIALFRPLDGNTPAEVEHHNTRYERDLCDVFTTEVAPSGPDEVAAVVHKVMVGEGSKWHEEVTSQVKAAKKNMESQVEEAGRCVNHLQLRFNADLRLLTHNFYPTRPQPDSAKQGPQILRQQFRCLCVCLLGWSMIRVCTFPCDVLYFLAGVLETLSSDLFHMNLF